MRTVFCLRGWPYKFQGTIYLNSLIKIDKSSYYVFKFTTFKMMYPLEVINSYLFAPCIEALKPTGGKLWYGYKSNCANGSKR